MSGSKRNGKVKASTTSLSVGDPEAMARVRRAAEITGTTLSKFVLQAADREAVRVLGSPCPSCGQQMPKKSKKAA